MPVGWYLRLPMEPAIGRIVVVDPPLAALVAGWDADVPLIKPVVAAGGDHVCLHSRTNVIINSTPTGAPTRPAPPYWDGCRTLEPDELFLLAPARLDSVDGRLFGPVSRSSVVGVFTPIWTESP
jgi:type IV secretory pathway protease TraF